MRRLVHMLAQMDERTRRRVVLMAVAVAGLLGYRVFSDGPVRQLVAVQAQYAAAVQRQTEMGSMNLDLEQLHGDFDKARQTLQEVQRQCATPAQASTFFEQLNAIATAHGLQPVSTSLSQPRRLFEDSALGLGERVVVQQAEVVVVGGFADLIQYLEELTHTRGRVFLSSLRIESPSGADPTPRASFLVGIVVESSSEGKP